MHSLLVGATTVLVYNRVWRHRVDSASSDVLSATPEKALFSNLETLRNANSKGIRIIIVAIAGFVRAHTRITEFIHSNDLDAVVHFCDSLGEEYMAFSERSRVFPNPNDRSRARDVAEQKGVAFFRDHPLGY